jgi:hypothetical protein
MDYFLIYWFIMNYNSQRTRNLFSADNEKLFKLSRTKIQDFLDCPRCFYLDRRCGTGQPPGFPFTLNSAVDALLKKEFDAYRAKGQPHPLMVVHKINGVPFSHPELDDWRMNMKGIQALHEPTNFIITGAVDDLWINPAGELIVVDYKATSTSKEITLDAAYRQSYKNQMEVYQWLLRQKGFKVSKTGYFVYCNGDASRESFEGKLEFSISIIPYTGNDSWIEPTLFKIRECLEGNICPERKESCDFCNYRAAVRKHLKDQE